jgi:hypothetical protein
LDTPSGRSCQEINSSREELEGTQLLPGGVGRKPPVRALPISIRSVRYKRMVSGICGNLLAPRKRYMKTKGLGFSENGVTSFRILADLYKTSAWQDFKDEVNLKGTKPSIYLNLSSTLPQIFGDWRLGDWDPHLQSPTIWRSIEERLRHIEGFLLLNYTSSLKSCQAYVL